MIKICGNCKSYHFNNNEPSREGRCMKKLAGNFHLERSFSPLSSTCPLFIPKKR